MSTPTPIRPRKGGRRRSGPTRGVRILVGLAILVVVIVALVIVLRYYVDWLWFGEVGLRTVFWTRIVAGVVVGVSFAVVFFALVYGNIEIACRFAPKYRPVRGVDFTELMQPTAVRRVRLIGLAVSLVGAVIVGFVTAGSWLIFVRALHAVPFGVQDPIFHHDLSFYVFSLPAWRYVYGFVFATLIVALILSIIARVALGGVLYAADRSERLQHAGRKADPGRARYAARSNWWARTSTRAPRPMSRRCLGRSSFSPAPATCSKRGTCSIPPLGSSSARATRTCTYACPSSES